MKHSKPHLFLAALFILLLVSPVISCGPSYTQEDLDAAYDGGYAIGYDKGYDAGESAGFAKGKAVGLSECKEACEQEKEAKYQEGYQKGHDEGWQAGYELGYNVCYCKGLVYCPPVATNIEPPDSTEPVTAICCDGTLSYSKHRSGTCSWHGGVCKWVNKPLD